MAYIDENDIYKIFENGKGQGIERIHIVQIDKLPRADVKAVVHGEWRMGESGVVYFCSKCRCAAHPRESERWNYCPNCGAKMDGVSE